MHEVTVIIPAYNAASTLAPCLTACLKQSHPAQKIVVVDDGSTDDTRRVVEQFAGIQYISQENRGPAAARNRGAAEALTEIIVFTDADCIPHEDWLEKLLAGFSDGVSGVGGSYGIANPDFRLARLIHSEIVARHARFSREVDFLGSFNVAYRKADFDRVGGFDVCFHEASGEDNDLAYRLVDAGGKLLFAREALVDHFHPIRLWPYLRTQMRHGYWRVMVYAKHWRRASGDRYAGVADLATPPLALFSMAALLFLPFLPRVFLFIPLAIYLFLRFAAAMPVLTGLMLNDKTLFLGVTILRDMARGIGLIQGMIRIVFRGQH
ncbi:MAG TPA: glycosyltransferase [Candidatus Hydrogenedentes bacterium]|nr:glycosyltransferase [Candidatus Hydrogenedentota bacterium]